MPSARSWRVVRALDLLSTFPSAMRNIAASVYVPPVSIPKPRSPFPSMLGLNRPPSITFVRYPAPDRLGPLIGTLSSPKVDAHALVPSYEMAMRGPLLVIIIKLAFQRGGIWQPSVILFRFKLIPEIHVVNQTVENSPSMINGIEPSPIVISNGCPDKPLHVHDGGCLLPARFQLLVGGDRWSLRNGDHHHRVHTLEEEWVVRHCSASSWAM